MKVLVTGAKGMLGTDLVACLASRGHRVVGVDVDELDITRRREVVREVTRLRPDVLINAAAYTDVDGSETNEELAFRVNAEAVENLARACLEAGCRLIHISTDYVFDGKKEGSYREDDLPRPVGVYGRSKWEGEKRLRGILPEACVIRTAWLYGKAGKNFVKAILAQAERKGTLRVVDDQRGSPTYTRDLAAALATSAELGLTGTYHVTNRGACTWLEFARTILDLAGRRDVEVLPISTAELGRPAPRPANSVLDVGKFEAATGLLLPPWQEALADYLRS